jgi:NitT/TauT family transport system substrate-binding protein
MHPSVRMRRPPTFQDLIFSAALFAAALVVLPGCSRSSDTPASGAGSTTSTPARSPETLLACVRAQGLAAACFTNGFLPADPQAPAPAAGAREKLRVSMPWVFNDEIAPWFLAQDRGWFRAVGLEVELVPGGPGIDPLQLLVAGRVDIAAPAAASSVVQLRLSRTGADVVALSAVLKGTPYCWIALDKSVPAHQRSSRRLSIADLVGKTVGIQPGYDYYVSFVQARHGLEPGSVKSVRAGFTPDPLVAGVMDFYAGWINNQPRLLEQAGYSNWMALEFRGIGWDEYGDLSVVRRETMTQRPDVLRRYAWALNQAVRFLLAEPAAAAELVAPRCIDVKLTAEQVRRRFELQRDLVAGIDGTAPLTMTVAGWENLVVSLAQFGQVQLPECP